MKFDLLIIEENSDDVALILHEAKKTSDQIDYKIV